MEKLKGKYEIILGFVTLIVSLSAFKDELAKVTLDLGFVTISLASYFLYSVYGFAICLYLYIVEHIVRDTKIGHWKIFNYLIGVAFAIFAIVLFSPIIIGIDLVALSIYNYIQQHKGEQSNTTYITILKIINGAVISYSILVSTKWFKKRQEKIQEQINEQEIIELERAIKLFESEYYSHFVLESFKVLETYLYKKITEKNHRVSRRLMEVFQTALKLKIINKDEANIILKLMAMRNDVAHNSNVQFSQSDAQLALDFVKQLVNKK